MTVASELNHNQYIGNGQTTSFDYGFRIFKNSHLLVQVSDLDGAITTLVLGTDYTVTGVGAIGGKVVLTNPLAAGWAISLDRNLPIVQETDLRNQGTFYAETHEDAFDYLTMLVQRVFSSFGLALKKPSWIAKYYDAQGNRIANLADPQQDQDAATKKYVDDLEGQNISRTLRVPEPINQLPAAAGRANKIPAFDAAGNAIVIVPPSGSASDVMIELAKATGAGKIGALSGLTVQGEIDAIHASIDHRNVFAYIEDFSNLVTAGDWTDAINAAFSTGKPVVGNGTYNVGGILKSKGQKIIGEFKINTSRYTLGIVSCRTEVPDILSVRMLYLESAYDLAELMFIKSLGFNTINHYCYFANNGTIDAAGTAEQLLNNAITAGLQVNLGTESPRANTNLSEFINATKDHPAVFGYSVYDEPASRGITIAAQDAKITQLRALTFKQLSFVDLVSSGAPFVKRWSSNYDIAFVDSYSLYYAGNSNAADKLSKDLNKMRFDFGTIKAHTGLTRVIPVVAAFTDTGGYYSPDKTQVLAATKIFATVDGGNWGAFVWDGVGDANISSRVRSDTDFQQLCRNINAQPVREKKVTEAYIFGGTSADGNWPISSLIPKIPVKDPSTADGYVFSNSYPVRVVSGATNSDRVVSGITGADYSGIGFRGPFASFLSTIKARKNTRCYFEYFNIQGGTSGSFSLFTTNDGGYTITLRYDDALAGNKVLNFNTSSSAPDDHLVFRIENTGDNYAFYRKFLRGLICCCDW